MKIRDTLSWTPCSYILVFFHSLWKKELIPLLSWNSHNSVYQYWKLLGCSPMSSGKLVTYVLGKLTVSNSTVQQPWILWRSSVIVYHAAKCSVSEDLNCHPAFSSWKFTCKSLGFKICQEQNKTYGKNVWDSSENVRTEISLPAAVLTICFPTSQIGVRCDGTRIHSATDITYRTIKSILTFTAWRIKTLNKYSKT